MAKHVTEQQWLGEARSGSLTLFNSFHNRSKDLSYYKAQYPWLDTRISEVCVSQLREFKDKCHSGTANCSEYLEASRTYMYLKEFSEASQTLQTAASIVDSHDEQQELVAARKNYKWHLKPGKKQVATDHQYSLNC